jgi:hypothetical protein
MKKNIGTVLIALGLLLVALACATAGNEPDFASLMGTYLPGIVVLAVGVKLRQENPRVGTETEDPLIALQGRRKSNAELGVVGGILLMFMGSGLSQQGHEVFLVGSAVSLGGWGLMLWGAVNYIQWKGYSGWLGLFGLLLLPGLIILACLPNKTKNAGNPFASQTMKTRSIVVIALVAIALLFVLPMVAFLTLPFMLSQMPRGQTTVWATVSSDPPMFTVEMPGKAQRQDVTEEGPGGEVTVTAYQSYDGVATYTAGFIPFPPNRVAPQEILDTLLDNTAAQLKGRALDRKTLSHGEYVGREETVEFMPGVKDQRGRPVVGLQVARVYFVRDAVVMLSVTLSKSDKDRPAMDARIARFFDSLKLDQRFPP